MKRYAKLSCLISGTSWILNDFPLDFYCQMLYIILALNCEEC